jgi:hypothetical protein
MSARNMVYDSVLQIRDVFPDPGSEFFHPQSQIPNKEFTYFYLFNQKKWFLSSRKYDPGCSFRIPYPDPDFLPIPDPGSRGQKAPDPDTQHSAMIGWLIERRDMIGCWQAA